MINTYPSGFTVASNPRFEQFIEDKDLSSMRLRELSGVELEIHVDLQRRTFESLPNQAAAHKLHMTFEAVDTEELKNLEISVDGTQGGACGAGAAGGGAAAGAGGAAAGGT